MNKTSLAEVIVNVLMGKGYKEAEAKQVALSLATFIIQSEIRSFKLAAIDDIKEALSFAENHIKTAD